MRVPGAAVCQDHLHGIIGDPVADNFPYLAQVALADRSLCATVTRLAQLFKQVVARGVVVGATGVGYGKDGAVQRNRGLIYIGFAHFFICSVGWSHCAVLSAS